VKYKFFWLIRALVYAVIWGKIGHLSYIGKPVFVSGAKRVFLSNRVRIFPGARLEVIDTTSAIKIAQNVSIGQNLHIIAGGDTALEVGKNTTISANVFISNVDHSYSQVGIHVMDQEHIMRTTQIGENCFIGYGSAILPGTVLGKHCIVGANSVVRGVFPDYCVLTGNPAQIIKIYDAHEKIWKKVN
jgi:acetyltransferase-like isoleucine patch superfamily enzyme